MWDIQEQVLEKLYKAKDHMAHHENKSTRDAHEYKPGDKVWLSTKGITMPWDKERPSKKLTAKYYGPFRIIRQTSAVTYELALPAASNIHPIMHVSLLKPVSSLERGHKAPPLPVKDDSGEYEVESILAHRQTKAGKKKYLVKWKGYTFEECTWEPASNFKSHMLQEYHRRRKDEKEDESDTDEEEHAAVMAATARLDGGQGCSGAGAETLAETPAATDTPQAQNQSHRTDWRD